MGRKGTESMDSMEQEIMDQAKQAGLEENQALCRLLLDLRRQDREDIRAALAAAEQAEKSAKAARRERRFALALAALCLFAALAAGAVFAAFAAGITIETETATTTQTVDGDDATINNVEGEQYNDNATREASD